MPTPLPFRALTFVLAQVLLSLASSFSVWDAIHRLASRLPVLLSAQLLSKARVCMWKE